MPSVLPGWNDWPSLIAAARAWPQPRRLAASLHERDLHLLLQAPVTLAWWLSGFAPQLLERKTLDLLVIGVPGGPSSTDEGRPYQLLPSLLGREALRVNVTVLVGSAEAVLPSRVHYPAPQCSLEDRNDAFPPALRSHDTIAKWWEMVQGKAPDACVLMQPEFDYRIDFWTGLRLLHEARVPVGCFARSEAEAERDAWMLSAYGYDVTQQTRHNPWAQRWPESRGHGAWAAVAWMFAPVVLPPASFAVDHGKLERAADAQRFLQHEFEVWNPLEYIGQRIAEAPLQGSDAVPPLIGLPDHHALSLATGDVWQMEPDGLVPVFGNTRLPETLLATYPADTSGSFERLLWAVDLYRDEFRPREAAAIEALGMARAEQLKDSISQAVQGRASAAELAAFETYYTGGTAPAAATPGSEPLFDALHKRDWTRAEAMLAADEALANAVDEDGRAPLHFALAGDHPDFARRLLDLGADPDHLDHEGFAVVHDMAKREDVGPLELLQRYGADLDLPTGLGMTPALLALRYGRWAVLGYLLGHVVDLRRATLPGASVAEQYEIVEELPRVLRAEIDRKLGKRTVIPIVPVDCDRPANPPSAGNDARPSA